MLAGGIAPQSIAIAGDSAGGGLALALLVSLRDAGDPMPAAAMLFSPWTDLACTGASVKENDRRDAMFVAEGMERGAQPYLNGTNPRNPLASPLYADLSRLPPLLVHVGSYEILLDDSRRLVERARAAGTSAQIQTWPVLPHVWQLFRMPETTVSMNAAADFLRAAITTGAQRVAA